MKSRTPYSSQSSLSVISLKSYRRGVALFLVLAAAVAAAFVTVSRYVRTSAKTVAPANRNLSTTYGQIPLSFEDATRPGGDEIFVARAGGFTLGLDRAGATMWLSATSSKAQDPQQS